MAFRSTADALLARADALERENAKLREKLADSDADDHELESRNAELSAELQSLRKQAAEQLAIERKRDKKRELRPTRKKPEQASNQDTAPEAVKSLWTRVKANAPLTVAIAIALAYGACELGHRLLGHSGGGTARPTIEEIYLLSDGETAPSVAVLYEQQEWTNTSRSKVTHDFVRLQSFDLRTGKGQHSATLLKRQERDNRPYKTFRRAGGKLWAHHPTKGLQLLELSTAEVVLDEASLGQKLPELGEYKVPLPSFSEHSPPTPAIEVILRDGRRAWIDMTPALLSAPPSSGPARPGYFCDAGDRPSCERVHCLGFTAIPGTTALQLASMGPYPNTNNTPTTAAGADASPLLRPGLVNRLDYSCALELEGKVLVLHDDVATGPKTALLSMLNSVGQILWTRNMAELTAHPASTALGGAVLGDEIYLLLSEHRRTLDLVRLSSDGDVIFRRSLF